MRQLCPSQVTPNLLEIDCEASCGHRSKLWLHAAPSLLALWGQPHGHLKERGGTIPSAIPSRVTLANTPSDPATPFACRFSPGKKLLQKVILHAFPAASREMLCGCEPLAGSFTATGDVRELLAKRSVFMQTLACVQTSISKLTAWDPGRVNT